MKKGRAIIIFGDLNLNATNFTILRGARGAALLLSCSLIFLLAPLAVQAQGIGNFATYQGSGLNAGARISLSGSSSHFPATISLNWGDGNSTGSTARTLNDNYKQFNHTYANCGVKSISVTVSFTGGASRSRTSSLTVGCQPEQPVEGGPIHCGLHGCRQVPDYFIENRQAIMRYIEDSRRRKERGDFSLRSLSEFGYRCPDAGGNECDTTWLPSPARNTGLSNPDSFSGSPLQARPNTGVQRINRDGIGIKAINDMNPIDAVNIWGEGAESGGEVCFRGSTGRLLYKDARVTPNTLHWLTPVFRGENICGNLPGPGSIIYLPPEN
jgi:hypothetical protein